MNLGRNRTATLVLIFRVRDNCRARAPVDSIRATSHRERNSDFADALHVNTPKFAE